MKYNLSFSWLYSMILQFQTAIKLFQRICMLFQILNSFQKLRYIKIKSLISFVEFFFASARKNCYYYFVKNKKKKRKTNTIFVKPLSTKIKAIREIYVRIAFFKRMWMYTILFRNIKEKTILFLIRNTIFRHKIFFYTFFCHFNIFFRIE